MMPYETMDGGAEKPANAPTKLLVWGINGEAPGEVANKLTA